ncbi:TPA: hypothetical protein U2D36_002233 [Streptococcus suis]|uniref:hypothetical protein n=1 Tax=Streptococcus suis TaxID=1307 RepID=UPI0004254981|nr:hypothetical protein [Streptococcus suis]HEM3199313.1 hypothetical protein [Streptococcus suis 14A]HEM6180599.1 hypothetical protein [Streptococcus suis]HEM6357779.1 hypothetical protein [Streptococcus suis]HEM6381945.1 hypothetical protein [Streptococcus suis]HEM6411383.1 hypothetical protein [Streptococcus suis]
MKKYFVPATNWKMFYQSVCPLPEPFNSAMYSAIFDHLASVTQDIFTNLKDENIAIIFAPFIDCPVSFPDDNLIFLHLQEINEHSQVIYQLGHELLHAYYKSPSNTPMFWLEEVLCEVASHLFLQGFVKEWSNSVNPLVRGFADFTLEYSKSQLQESEPVNLKQLPLDYLKDNPIGNRKINTYIAAIMFPIFQGRPDFLAECRKLSALYTETDLNIFFNKAYSHISPEYHLELKKLETLFI